MLDVSDDSDEDYEWSMGKINYNRKMRGTLIGCEIISVFHDGAIVEAGENKALFCEAYVVNERVLSCVKAAPARFQSDSSLGRRSPRRAIGAAV